jgi:hypothetical protein
MPPQGRRIGQGGLARKVQRLCHHRVDPALDGSQFRLVGQSVVLHQPLAEHVDRIAPDPGIHLFLRAVGADDRVALVVATTR